MTYIGIVITIILVFVIAFCMGIIYLLIKMRGRKKSGEQQEREEQQRTEKPQQDADVQKEQQSRGVQPEQQIWEGLLKEYENAHVYNGLYSGLLRLVEGSAKRPERVIREWCQRTRYRWEGSAADEFCWSVLVPAAEEKNQKAMVSAAKLLLDAAEHVGITAEEEQQLVLDDTNANAYVEWDGEELYEGDTVEIIAPAWYHCGKVLEQGQCQKLAEGEQK